MTNRIRIQNLLRLTLTLKGQAVAKHPLLREGVIEAIKASVPDEETPLWEEPQASESGSEVDADWYGDFTAFILTAPAEDIPESWEATFSSEEYAVKAGRKKKNYPASRGPFAGPHNSFPIKTQQDVYDAARLVGHAQNPAAVRARIIAIAHSKGFSLPKSWAAKKSAKTDDANIANIVEDPMDEAKFEELVARLQERFAPAAAVTPKETPVEGGAEPVVEKTVEKAKGTSHSHMHPHSTMRGYGYEHAHEHSHSSMDDHDTSESAHGHDHVAKAGEAGEADVPNVEELVADVAGLDADLKAKVSEFEAMRAEYEALKTQFAEKAKVADEVEAVKAELKAAVEAVKQPLIASAPQTAEKAKVNPKTLSFDDAFSAILHS